MSVEIKVNKTGKTNKFIHDIINSYKKYSTKEERNFDWYVPLCISFVIIIILILSIGDGTKIISLLKEFNSIVITVVAILAGFNSASLSVIASSNIKTLGLLFSSKRGEDSNLLLQTVSLFGYSIIIEILILMVGIILIFIWNVINSIVSNIPDTQCYCIIVNSVITIIAIPWITVIFHSL